MPIQCPIIFPRLSQDEMGALDYEVMGQAFAAHKELGCLCDEPVYEAHLTHLLAAAELKAERQVQLTLTFRSFLKMLCLDLVVDRRAIYELKTVAGLADAHGNQLLNYLFLTNVSHGKLINFRPTSLESRFINSALDDEERRRFEVDTSRWSGDGGFQHHIEELVADWGTGLDHSLYTQAIVHCFGGEQEVTRQVPMHLGGLPIGHQRFHLVDEHTAFRITTFQEDLTERHQHQLRKLMAPSPVKTFYWVNIARHRLSLQTITI